MFGALKRRFGQLIPSEYPSQAWFTAIDREGLFTPDIRDLEKQFAHYVFVCDEMQSGHKNAGLMAPAFGETLRAPVVKAAFTRPEFTLWKKALGKESFAIPLENHSFEQSPYVAEKDVPHSICGELHLISPQTFIAIDKYKENGVMYERKLVDIIIPYTKTKSNQYATCEFAYKCQIIPAWLYVGVPEYWADHLDAGFQFTQVKTVPQAPMSTYGTHDFITFPYYHFTQDEYKTTS